MANHADINDLSDADRDKYYECYLESADLSLAVRDRERRNRLRFIRDPFDPEEITNA